MPDSAFDVDSIRAQFPALSQILNGRPVVFLDNPGGTQVHQSVVEAMTDYLLHHNANHGGAFATSQRSDAILDAAAQGRVTVRRGPLSAIYPSSLTLVGSMNPEEGALRPQIQDRFGLRVLVDGLEVPEERLEVYRRVRAFREHPHWLIAALAEDTISFGEEIERARDLLPRVEFAPGTETLALRIIHELKISSHRAEITTLEAARAHAAADGRELAVETDVAAVAPMALRQRRSKFMHKYFQAAKEEEARLEALCAAIEEAD